ncbi:MAG TPA: hypothetical protein VFQ53_19245 [Kofleriaceae bacterium]|nr:hypothetical protein [Kofleriaceae bacterium]
MAAALGASGEARGDTVRYGDQTTVIANAEVRALISDGNDRAYAGINQNGWWLGVEQLQYGRPAWQHWVTDLSWGRSQVNIARDVRSIQLTGLRNSFLTFNAHYEGRDWIKCTIDMRANTWVSSCEGRYTGNGGAAPPPPNPTPPPPPQPTNYAGVPAVIRQCGDTFEGPQNENACLDAVTAFRYDPTKIIAQCDATMEGDTNELACVRAAAAAAFDPSLALARCDNTMEGDANELACFQVVVRARYNIAAAIDACDAAMEGDTNELACITAATWANADPSATIKQCDDSMSGDEAELGCVKRALGVR